MTGVGTIACPACGRPVRVLCAGPAGGPGIAQLRVEVTVDVDDLRRRHESCFGGPGGALELEEAA